MSQQPNGSRGGHEPDWLGPCMFTLSLVFLALLAAIMVLWIDVPRVVETSEMLDLAEHGKSIPLSPGEIVFEQTAFRWGKYCGFSLLLLWPIFVAEQAYYLLRAKEITAFLRQHPFFWLLALIPPLRLCARRREATEQIWLPTFGWQVVDRRLRKSLERLFSVPMIWIALLILPVLGLQFYFQERISDYPHLRIMLHIGTGLIWFAFAVEFLVMVSVAEKKLLYCKQHWLDLAIILLPLISFLRTLKILRASRLMKMGKLQQLSRVVRIYRLRGVAMRALRAVMLLEVIHRLLRTTPEKRIELLEARILEKRLDLEELEEELRVLKANLPATSSNLVNLD